MEDFHGKPYGDAPDEPVRYDSNLISTIAIYIFGFVCGSVATAIVAWLI